MSAALSIRGVGKVHPDLTLREPSNTELVRHAQGAIQRRDRTATTTIITDAHTSTNSPAETSAAWSNRLPIGILIRILKYILLVRGLPVHAISRLDPFYKPHTVPRTPDGQPTYLRKFHIGTAPMNLSFAPGPSTLLAPLSVCTRWHYVGSTIFYGENTFAFSSLGE